MKNDIHQDRDIYRAIFDQMHHFVALLDLDGEVVMVNGSALERLAVDRSELVGRPAWETKMWRGANQPAQRLRRAIERAAQGELDRFRAAFGGHDERSRELDLTVKPLENVDGEVIGVIAEGLDVTEQKRAEHDLRVLESQYRAIFENTGSPTFISGEEGIISLVNHKFAELTGYLIEEIEGKMRAWDLIDKESLKQVLDFQALVTKPAISRRHPREGGGPEGDKVAEFTGFSPPRE